VVLARMSARTPCHRNNPANNKSPELPLLMTVFPSLSRLKPLVQTYLPSYKIVALNKSPTSDVF
jgi:hypothetical protein